ncbi:MAG: hypothetical protein ACR2OV_11480 [Hyphomicrobiaceae bacterium]
MFDLVRERFFKKRNQVRVQSAGHPELRPIYPDRTILTGMIDLDNSGNRRALCLYHRHNHFRIATAMQSHQSGTSSANLDALSERVAPQILEAFVVKPATGRNCNPPM